jgi:hypothetical protein
MPAYLVGQKTIAREVFWLKCNLDSVAHMAGNWMCSHSCFNRD